MLLRSLLESRNAFTSIRNPAPWLYTAFGATTSAAGKTVTESSALGLPTVYACVRVLAEALEQLPIKLYRLRDDGTSRDEYPEHPLYRVLNVQANEYMTAATWKGITMTHAAAWGNAYSKIIRNGRNEIVELWPLMPDATTPRLTGDRRELVYETTLNDKTMTLRADEVIHIKAMGYDGYIGWSPIRCEAERLGIMLAQQEFEGKFYANGAQLQGVLKAPTRVEDKEALRQSWERLYSGSDKAFRTAVLENGMEYERIGVPPAEAQFVEQQKWNALQVANIFRVPPHMINVLDRVTHNNIEHMGIDFVRYTLAPWFCRIEQEIARKCLKRDERRIFVKVAANALMRGDTKTRAEYYRQALGGSSGPGWMSVNDVRQKEDMNPIDGGDEVVMGTVFDQPPQDEEVSEQDRAIRVQLARRELTRLWGIVRKAGDDPADMEKAWLGESDRIAEVFHVDPTIARNALALPEPMTGPEELLKRLGLWK